MSEMIPQEIVQQKIFVVRGHKVMLDKDLAILYGVETRVLMQSVRRNIERFPVDFVLALSREEIMRISQIVTSLKYSKSVYAFTEQGIAMLSGILNSKRAIAVNIAIMRAFVKLREFLSGNKELARKVEEHSQHITFIYKLIDGLREPPKEKPKRKIGFRTND